MTNLLKLALLPLCATLAAGGSAAVPPQNVERGERPGDASALAGAARLLAAIKADDPALAADFFFPADAFDLVKDLPAPGRYHRKLVRWYQEDIHTEHQRFKSSDWQVEKIELGHCKWKEPGTEGNKLPYWSCRRNMVTARAGDRTRRFEIVVLINWGEQWYVTHLGPIRK